jgi:hypothetical protein
MSAFKEDHYIIHIRLISRFIILFILCFSSSLVIAQTESDVDKIRTESGVDPTRVASRFGFTLLFQNPAGPAGQITNRVSMNLGVNMWSLSAKYEVVSVSNGIPGEGFQSNFGDLKFGILNAFYVEGSNAFAGSVEFSVPFGKPGFGSQYFSMTPSVTYSYTIDPSLFLAVQPQYTFNLLKDPSSPALSVLTIRAFIAKFLSSGYFLVIEPRPIYDFTNDNFDLIISPILGKALGAGFNIILIAEFPTKKTTFDNKGPVFWCGFNKSI